MSARRTYSQTRSTEAHRSVTSYTYGTRGPAEGQSEVRWHAAARAYRALFTLDGYSCSGYGDTEAEAIAAARSNAEAMIEKYGRKVA
jgi:hypothetical protein